MSATRTQATASSGYVLLFNSGVYDFAGDGPVHMVSLGRGLQMVLPPVDAACGVYDFAGHGPVHMVSFGSVVPPVGEAPACCMLLNVLPVDRSPC